MNTALLPSRYTCVLYLFAIILVMIGLGNGQATEADHGIYGMKVTISADGLWNPTIEDAKILAVTPGLPAEKAGIVSGDEVLEVDGIRVPGATSQEMHPLSAGKKIGEHVVLVLKRIDGSTYSVDLIAVPKQE